MASDNPLTSVSDAASDQPREDAHEDYTERLRRLGVRVTPQRLFVLEALALTGGHTTAEEVMRWVSRRYPALNLATVYRALDVLVSVGLVAQTNLGGGAAYYELVGDSPHHHLACERCGAVIEMDESLLTSLRDDALRLYGFHARPRHLAIFGLCDPCYRAGQPDA
ncbi:MAG: transcriptional repressor [Chloroflexota bacterium]|nr:transcriptional repressor [Chloroflexota bacterium]